MKGIADNQLVRLAVTLACVFSALQVSDATPMISRKGCEAVELVPRYKHLRAHCNALLEEEESEIDELFAAMPAVTPDMPFPLAGCVAGCPAGQVWKQFSGGVAKNSSFRQMCFMNVVEGDFATGVVAMIHRPGQPPVSEEIAVEDSWSNTIREKNRGPGVWAINYGDDGPSGTLEASSYVVVREEMRQGNRNTLLVKDFVKVTFDNGEVAFAEFVYALFQVCESDGSYALTPIESIMPSQLGMKDDHEIQHIICANYSLREGRRGSISNQENKAPNPAPINPTQNIPLSTRAVFRAAAIKMHAFEILLLAVGVVSIISAAPVFPETSYEKSQSATGCVPINLPDRFDNFDQYCRHLQNLDDSVFEEMFLEAPSITETTEFPLKGCSFGCVVGSSPGASYANRRRNAGSWNGKCFKEFEDGTMPKKITNIRSGDKGVWVLDYSDTPLEYGRSFRGYRDELREIAPGIMVGKVFLKPGRTPYNFWRRDSTLAFNFVLFQVTYGRNHAV
ncbi:hypothetical protein BSKO_10675 [Bryopsis sp. KO-2023]|nr:hypothetical protein BSKO_10675 [Bryopsis sp. KO-2023]